MPAVRLAVIGLGVIGRRMIEQARMRDDLIVVGAWDIDPMTCERAARDYPGLAVAPDAHQLISRADVDVVYVGTPPSAHRHHAIAAAANGKKVFCEKPLAADLIEGEQLADELARSGAPNAFNFVYASAPCVLALERALNEQRLGQIVAIDIRLFFSRWPRDWQAGATWLSLRQQGGFVREVLSHFVYLCIRLFGECRLADARVDWPTQPELCERSAWARLECGGTPVTVVGAAGGFGPDEVVFTVRGTTGAARLSNWYELSFSDGAQWHKPASTDDASTDVRTQSYQAQLGSLVQFCRGSEHPLPDAALALRVQRVIEGILASR